MFANLESVSASRFHEQQIKERIFAIKSSQIWRSKAMRKDLRGLAIEVRALTSK